MSPFHSRAIACTLAVMASAGAAQAQSPTRVDVEFGPAVQTRAHALGADALRQEADYLTHDVLAAVRRSAHPPAAVHLVIVDIQPNRPTATELGLSPQLSHGSFGVGGAAVTGEVVAADGRRTPVRWRFFQDELSNETNFTTWGDADQSFDDLAARIGAGRPAYDSHPWPPPHTPQPVTGSRIPD